MISTSFVPNLALLPSFVQLYKRLVLPVVLCLSDASLIIVDNCNALGLILLPARRLVSACTCLIYGGTCKVSNLSLFVTQFTSRVGRFESSTCIPSMSVTRGP